MHNSELSHGCDSASREDIDDDARDKEAKVTQVALANALQQWGSGCTCVSLHGCCV